MCKKWAYYVRFACVLFCISCTLFLNTLHVSAATTYSWSHRFVYSPIFDPQFQSSTGTSIVTGTISNYIGYHEDIVFPFRYSWSGTMSNIKDKGIQVQFLNMKFSHSSTMGGSWQNAYLTCNGIFVSNISTSEQHITVPASVCESFIHRGYQSTNPNYYSITIDLPLELHLNCFDTRVRPTTSSLASECYDNVSVSVTYQSVSRSGTSYPSGGVSVKDSNSDAIKEATEKTQEATEEVAETTGSIFSSITDFFGSFFENLIGIFVPDDDFFTTWFNSLNTLLTDKLGILYYPFSVIINFLNRCTTAFANQGNGTDIVFPAIEFTNAATNETYTFLSAQHINLADFNVTTSSSPNSSLVGSSGFGSLVDIIRTFNAFVILFCLLSLLRTKLNLILREDNNDN